LLGTARVSLTARRVIMPREVYRDFKLRYKFIQASFGKLPEIRPPQLPSSSFPIYHSLIILSINAVYSEVVEGKVVPVRN
jgi:hypothetical protein